MANISIYGLLDPISEKIMYVGKTKQNLQRRCNQHINSVKNKNKPKDIWIQNLIKLKKAPFITLLEEVNYENWVEREKYWIKYYSELNPDLTNIYNGGSGPGNEEHCRRMSIKRSKPIYQLDKNLNIINKYSSCKEALNLTGINHINSAVRKNNIKTAGGFIWVYIKDYEEFLNNPIKKNFKLDRSHFYKKVKMYDKNNKLLETFTNVKEASEKTKIPYRMICSAAGGYKRTCKGYIWKYENEILYKRK